MIQVLAQESVKGSRYCSQSRVASKWCFGVDFYSFDLQIMVNTTSNVSADIEVQKVNFDITESDAGKPFMESRLTLTLMIKGFYF